MKFITMNVNIPKVKINYHLIGLRAGFSNIIFKIFAINLLIYSSLNISTAQSQFTDITEKAGINHHFEVLEGMFGGGVCAFDYNNDGFDDLYITGGLQADILYRNNKNGSFTNVTVGSGLELCQKYVTQGVVSADINKDGLRDLLITTISEKNAKKRINRAINLLFLNKGNGKFQDVTTQFGLGKTKTFSTSASFGDVNNDGFPDLYIGNYFNEYDGELSEVNDATVVGANQIAKGDLFINNGGKNFVDAFSKYGLNHSAFGFGGVFTDFDNDGDMDIYLNHDFGYKRTPNMLLENCHPFKKFKDVASKYKIDLQINAMGTAVGDINNDGKLEYFITNIRSNKFMVYNADNQEYEDQSQKLGTGYNAISWGANFSDFDNDGDLDLFVANGDLNPNCNPMSNFYFKNTNGHFEESSRMQGLVDYGIARGMAVFDLENDGDLDIFVVNQKAVLEGYPVPSLSKLFRNDLNTGNYLEVKLIGKNSNSEGLGARLTLVFESGLELIREVDGGASSQYSQNSTVAHFGIPQNETIKHLKINWIGEGEQILEDIKVNTIIKVEEKAQSKNFLYFVFGTILGFIVIFMVYRVYNLKIKSLF